MTRKFAWGTIKFIQTLQKITPESIKNIFTKGAARAVYYLDRRHTNIAKVNMELAYGDSLSDKEKKKIIKRCYEHIIFNLGDFIANQGISKDELLKKVSFTNEKILTDALKSKRPIILITAHYGNWELGTLAIAAKFTPVSAVGRPLENSTLNELLSKTRGQFNVSLISKEGAMKEMVKVMRRKGVLGLVVDQNTAVKEGILIDFFGKKARHTPSAAILSRKFNAIVIPVFSRTDEHKHYNIKFYNPIPMEKTEDMDADIHQHVQKQAALTEKIIREKPEEWLWIHRRWKNRYEEFYK